MDAKSPEASVKDAPMSVKNAKGANEGSKARKSEESLKKRGRPKDGKAAPPKEKVRKTTKENKHKVQPVDVDRQCGVPLTDSDGNPTGGLCARSLTCKTHSMGAKRSVMGRSQLYDVLLAAYQKKNQLKSAEKGHSGSASKARTAAAARGNPQDSDSDDSPRLPDGEEINEVLRGALMSAPQPLDRALILSTRLRSQRISLSEFLYNATSQVSPPPASASPLAAVMASTQSIVGRCVIFERYTHTQSVRPSQVYALERLSQRPHNDPRANVSRLSAARMNAATLTPNSQSDSRPSTSH